jgi:integrase
MASSLFPDFVPSIPVPATTQILATKGFEQNGKKSVAKSVANKPPAAPPTPNNQLSVMHDAFTKKSHHMILHSPFKGPKIYNAGHDLTKRWYIEFYYLYPGSADQYKRFKEPLGINKIKTLQERMIYAKEAEKFVLQKLQTGFNPFTAKRVAKNHLQPFLGIQSQLSSIVSLLSINASKSQKNTYQEMCNRLMKYLDQNTMLHSSMYDFSLSDARAFKEWMLHDADLAPKTVNNTISHLQMFWDRAVEEQLTEQNPFKLLTKVRLRDKPVDPSAAVRFEPITDSEMVKLFEELRAAGEFNFIVFLGFVYYAWARPVEILRLTVADIELERQLIRFKQGQTKNGKASYVQIVPPLMALISSLELQKYPGHYFVFSDGYQPGERMLSKNNPSTRWRDKVKNKIGIHKDLYALKHTGNIEYLLRNKGMNNLKWQQLQNRHSSAVITETYNKRIGAYFIEIKDLNFRIC